MSQCNCEAPVRWGGPHATWCNITKDALGHFTFKLRFYDTHQTQAVMDVFYHKGDQSFGHFTLPVRHECFSCLHKTLCFLVGTNIGSQDVFICTGCLKQLADVVERYVNTRRLEILTLTGKAPAFVKHKKEWPLVIDKPDKIAQRLLESRSSEDDSDRSDQANNTSP